MTERELCGIRLLRVEAELVRELIKAERDSRSEAALCEHLGVIEARRFELMAWILEIPDDRVRLICVMRFMEGRSWETIARRLHYERTSPAKILRRWFGRVNQ